MSKQDVWETQEYYQIAKEASRDLSHPGLKLIKRYAKTAQSVLEVGCGDGTKLDLLTERKCQCVGIDISQTAVKKAQKQYPGRLFITASAEDLPFAHNSFDLVYSAFMLEHTVNPEKVIKEMVRVVKPDGYLIIVAPNFGAPSRCSPCFKGNRLTKLISGLVDDFVRIFVSHPLLSWQRVEPLAKDGDYDIDWDTTVEPYLGSIMPFIKTQKMIPVYTSSAWEVLEAGESVINKVFRMFGKTGMYPFVNWGPHIVVAARKRL